MHKDSIEIYFTFSWFLYMFLQIFEVGASFWYLNKFKNNLKWKSADGPNSTDSYTMTSWNILFEWIASAARHERASAHLETYSTATKMYS
jgi:hypothetical protein